MHGTRADQLKLFWMYRGSLEINARRVAASGDSRALRRSTAYAPWSEAQPVIAFDESI